MLEQLLSSISENLATKLVVLTIAGTTVATSGVAGYKIVKTFEGSRVQAAPIDISPQEDTPSNQEGQTNPSPSASPVPKSQKSLARQTTGTSGSTGTPTAIPTRPSANGSVLAQSQRASGTTGVTNNTCIVTVFGARYDLTNFQHPKPIQFTCGTDITNMFQGAHGGDIARLAPYKITASASGTTGATSGASGSFSSGSTGSTGATSSTSRSREEYEDDHEEEDEEEKEEMEHYQDSDKEQESDDHDE